MGSRGDRSFQRPRVLAVASEAGSAKAMIPVLASLVSKGIETKALVPQDVIRFAAALYPELDRRDFEPIRPVISEEFLHAFGPDALLVGTTPADSAERRLILQMREKRIRTVAIVDERYGFSRRFSDGKNRLCYLTDRIALMDEECFRKALSEGLPSPRLHVTGSPLLSHLVSRTAPDFQKADSRTDSWKESHKRVVFISETFKRDNGTSFSRPGRLGSFMGFTEETVREDILKALSVCDVPVLLVERMHPSDTQIPCGERVLDKVVWRQIKNGDLWGFLHHRDLVIGMQSMALLEAGLLGCRVASYQPGLTGTNTCAAVRFELAERLETRQQLKVWIRSALSEEKRPEPPLRELPFIRHDAAENVARLFFGAIP